MQILEPSPVFLYMAASFPSWFPLPLCGRLPSSLAHELRGSLPLIGPVSFTLSLNIVIGQYDDRVSKVSNRKLYPSPLRRLINAAFPMASRLDTPYQLPPNSNESHFLTLSDQLNSTENSNDGPQENLLLSHDDPEDNLLLSYDEVVPLKIIDTVPLWRSCLS